MECSSMVLLMHVLLAGPSLKMFSVKPYSSQVSKANMPVFYIMVNSESIKRQVFESLLLKLYFIY